MIHNQDDAQDTFRRAVLAAMDDAAREIFGGQVLGATDADLPHFFPALDAQLERLSQRFEHQFEKAN
jgi:hypothetical protein